MVDAAYIQIHANGFEFDIKNFRLEDITLQNTELL